jgi:hypothetical protein
VSAFLDPQGEAGSGLGDRIGSGDAEGVEAFVAGEAGEQRLCGDRI